GTGAWTAGEPGSFSSAWQRCNPGCGPIPGATDSAYTPSAADVGGTVEAMLTITSPFVAGSVLAVTNTLGPIVVAKPYTAILPTISGTTTVGSALTASSSLA